MQSPQRQAAPAEVSQSVSWVQAVSQWVSLPTLAPMGDTGVFEHAAQAAMTASEYRNH